MGGTTLHSTVLTRFAAVTTAAALVLTGALTGVASADPLPYAELEASATFDKPSFDITEMRDRLGEQGQWDDERVRISFSTEVPGAPRSDDDTAGRESAAARPDVRARRVAILVD